MIRSTIPRVKEKVVPPSLSLATSIQYLKGVGPQRCALFRRIGIGTLRDLLHHLPRRHEDRRFFPSIAQLIPDQKAAVRGQVAGTSLFRTKTGTLILQVAIKDATGTLTALWFNQPYMRRWFPTGMDLILYGMVEKTGRRLQMIVPEFEVVPKEAAGKALLRSIHMGRIVPIYPATSGLHQREVRTAVARALKALLPTLTDPLPEKIRVRQALLPFPEAIKGIHFPAQMEAIEKAKERFTFDELFYFQLALGLRRRALRQRTGIAHELHGDLVERWRKGLPFTLTPGQERAAQEIGRDMALPQPMHRLLQGEVGSGKTVVAAYAMVVALQNGSQAALLAPTEILARQHALTLTQLFAPIEIPVALLTSAVSEASRQELARDLSSGAAQIVVGTHALLEPWVSLKKLGLVVIDEQQKFGVAQRDALCAKGKNPDLLIVTATPIPRTLALTLYGEMAISTITERPAGRQPVRTIWMDSTKRETLVDFMKRELCAGRQAYVVCPRIGKEAPSSLFALSSSATQLFEEYQRSFPEYKVGLLHGRMNQEEQKRVFAAFKRGQIQILVATQIIEVGVDLANATVMVIERADRFGLAQLHQLRGRVGRGAQEGTCILMADPQSPVGKERLEKVVTLQDAFGIAEEDLRFRGPGELLGKRQAGLPDLKCLAWALTGPWMERAKDEADAWLASDANLAAREGISFRKEMSLRFPRLLQGCA